MIIAVRDENKGEKAVEDILKTSKELKKEQFRVMRVDFSKQSSILDFANKFNAEYNHLNGLVNNAAIGGTENKEMRHLSFGCH